MADPPDITRPRGSASAPPPPPLASPDALGDGLLARLVREGAVIAEPSLPGDALIVRAEGAYWRAYDLRSSDAAERRRVQVAVEIGLDLDEIPGVLPLDGVVEDAGWVLLRHPDVGPTLREHLDAVRAGTTQSLGTPRYVELLVDASCTLEALHERGFVHRDVRPETLFLVQDARQLLVGGLSVARQYGFAPGYDGATRHRLRLRGRDRHIAPEQFAGETGPSVDEYALAVTAYDVLSGPGMTPLTGPVDAVLQRGMAQSPSQRHATTAAFGTALTEAMRVEAPRSIADRIEAWSPPWRAGLVPAVLIAMLGVPLLYSAGHDFRDLGVVFSVALTVSAIAIGAIMTIGIVGLAGAIRGRRTRWSLLWVTRWWVPPLAVVGLVGARGLSFDADAFGRLYWPLIGLFALRAVLAPAPPRSGLWLVRALRRGSRFAGPGGARRVAVLTGGLAVTLAVIVGPVLIGRGRPVAPTLSALDVGPMNAVWDFRGALYAGDRAYVCKNLLRLPARDDRPPCDDFLRLVGAVQRADPVVRNRVAAYGIGKNLPDYRLEPLPAPKGRQMWLVQSSVKGRYAGSMWNAASGQSDRYEVSMSREAPRRLNAEDSRSNWLYDVGWDGRGWRITGVRACTVGGPGTGKNPADCDITDGISAAAVERILEAQHP
ncbi:MAG TPA: hypothetical protein VMF35_18405 [Acidimicrobiales bacterium]|nr:hypothetical protein [Acidimicrobiales bacterium]